MLSPLSLAFLSAFLAAAQAAPAGPGRRSAEAAFEETYRKTLQEAAGAFLEGGALPMLALPADPSTSERFSAQTQKYAVLASRVAYIQAGRPPDDDVESFHAYIRKVAADLGVDPERAVIRYGYMVRPEAGGAPVSVVETAVRAGLIAELLQEPMLPKDMKRRLASRLDHARKALEEGLSGDDQSFDPDAVLNGWLTRNRSSQEYLDGLPPRVQPLSMRIIVPPEASGPPPRPGSVLAAMDWDRASELATEAWENSKRFMGKCYRYVKAALDSILPEGWRSEVGQGSAYQFAKSLNSNPALFGRLKLRRVPVEELPGGMPPIGAIVVYGKNQCGFSPVHGHIEIVVSHDPPKACSDGCTAMDKGRLTCIRKKGKPDARGGPGQVSVYIPVRS